MPLIFLFSSQAHPSGLGSQVPAGHQPQSDHLSQPFGASLDSSRVEPNFASLFLCLSFWRILSLVAFAAL